MRYRCFPHANERYDNSLIQLFGNWKSIAEEKKFQLIIVFLPGQAELEQGRYHHNMSRIREALMQAGIPHIDLTDCYLIHTKEGKNVSDFFWPKDKHHNAQGYQMMAECIYHGIHTGEYLQDP